MLNATAIDLDRDSLKPVSSICEQRTGKRAAPSKVWRWRIKGVRGVKLEAVLINECWHATNKAFSDFIRGQTAAATSASKTQPATEAAE